jgi:hypothetical protein
VVLTTFLASLGLALAASAFATIQGIKLKRAAGRSGRALAPELRHVEAGARRLEETTARLDDSSARLEAARERLRVSRARLQVLLDEVDVAQRRVSWLTAFWPR